MIKLDYINIKSNLQLNKSIIRKTLISIFTSIPVKKLKTQRKQKVEGEKRILGQLNLGILNI